MKLMFASDIHGSYYYAQKTVEAYREEKAEKLILLGDILTDQETICQKITHRKRLLNF